MCIVTGIGGLSSALALPGSAEKRQYSPQTKLAILVNDFNVMLRKYYDAGQFPSCQSCSLIAL